MVVIAEGLQSIKIMSGEQLNSVRAYVFKARTLSYDREAVIRCLNDGVTSAFNVTIDDVDKAYNAIKTHAEGWVVVEKCLKELSHDLVFFCATFKCCLNDTIDFIERLPTYKTYSEKVKNLNEEQIEAISSFFLSVEDGDVSLGIARFFNAMSALLEGKKIRVSEAHSAMAAYKDTLNYEVKYLIGKILSLDTLQELNGRVDKVRRDREAERNKIYAYSSYDEHNKYEINANSLKKFDDKEKELLAEISKGKVVGGSLNDFHDELAVFDLFIDGALKDISTIESELGVAVAYVQSSKTKMSGINSLHPLRRFVLDLKGVKSDWSAVNKVALTMLDVLGY
jgi:hypothetical protein